MARKRVGTRGFGGRKRSRGAARRLIAAFEHPWVLGGAAVVAGVCGVFYYGPLLAVAGIVIWGGIVRSDALAGTNRRARRYVSATILIVLLGLMGRLRIIIAAHNQKAAYETIAGIVSGITPKLPDSPAPRPTATPIPEKEPKAVLKATAAGHSSAPAQPGATPADSLKPDVTLSLVGTLQPAVILHNNSSAVAFNIKWGVEIWDTASAAEQVQNPLPFPIQTYDWIKPSAYGGPMDVFSRFLGQLKNGDVVEGTAFVDCPYCKRGHTYLVYIVWGSGGWYSEWTRGNGGPAVPSRFSAALLQRYFQFIGSIPIGKRLAIYPN